MTAVYLSSFITRDSLEAFSNALEAGFNTALNAGVQKRIKAADWIRENSVSYFHEIQTAFNFANAGFLLHSGYTLITELKNRYNITLYATGAHSALINKMLLGSTIIPVAIGIIALDKWNTRNFPQEENLELEKEEQVTIRCDEDGTTNPEGEYQKEEPLLRKFTLKIGHNYSGSQMLSQFLKVAGTVMNLATAFFSKNPYLLAFSIAASIYNYHQNTQIKWIYFSRSFPFSLDNVPEAQKLNTTYHMLMLPPGKAQADDKCSVCLSSLTEGDSTEQMAFCTKHIFHKDCLSEIPKNQSEKLEKIYSLVKNSNIDRDKENYDFYIHESKLPCCPTCRDIPLANYVEMSVTEADIRTGKNRDVTGTVHVTRTVNPYRAPLQRFYAAYNVIEAGAAYLSTYPELRDTIFKVSGYVDFINLAGLAITGYNLYHTINDKYNPRFLDDSGRMNPKYNASFETYLSVGLIAGGVLTLIGLTYVSPYVLPVSRIIASMALYHFSEEKKANGISIAAQTATLLSNIKAA